MAPFHCTTDDGTKLAPVRVKVKLELPAASPVGDSEVSVGAGADVVVTTEKGSEFEVPPPGVQLVTTTAYVPGLAWSPAVNGIVSWLEFTKVTACCRPLRVTVEPEKKLVPLIVSVLAGAPAETEAGDRVAIVGAALTTVKLTVLEKLPPLDVQFVTTTG